jgi:hypothetical protein
MARKNNKNKPKMVTTTERTLPILSANASQKGMTVKLDKLLSQVNHKLYRQGMCYHGTIEIARAQQSTQDRSYSIYTLPTDHRTIGMLRMARSVYNEAMRDELEVRPEVKSPWTDFKIGVTAVVDAGQWAPLRNDGYVAQLTTGDGDTTGKVVRGLSDNYEVSEITDAAGAQRSFQLKTVVTPTTEWNVYQEYKKFLLNRADPDSALEVAAYADASAVLTEMQELADKGDEPPYSWAWKQYDVDAGAEQAISGLTVQLAGVISPDQNPRSLQRISFEAPVGLVFIVCDDNMQSDEPELIIRMSSGNYKGVKADNLYPKDKLLGF